MLLPKVRLNAEVAGFLGAKRPEVRKYAITIPGEKRFSMARAGY